MRATSLVNRLLEADTDNRYVGDIQFSFDDYDTALISLFLRKLAQERVPVVALPVSMTYPMRGGNFGVPVNATVRLRDLVSGNWIPPGRAAEARGVSSVSSLSSLLERYPYFVLTLSSESALGAPDYVLLGDKPVLEKILRQHAAASVS